MEQPSLFPPFPPVSGLTPERFDASKRAAKDIAGKTSILREQVYDAIVRSGDYGRTDRELQRELRMGENTERPRRWELWLAGRIRIKRDAQGRPVFRREGPGSKSIVYVVGAEERCSKCGQVYTKAFDD